MASIQDGDRLYVRAVIGKPYEFLIGDPNTGALVLGDVIGDPNTQWIARVAPDRSWTLECQHPEGRLRYLDSDAGSNVTLDDDPSDASTHWQLVQLRTTGHWQIRSRSYGHFLSVGERVPTVITDGENPLAHWELLLIAQ
jgi:hypothetical protein